MTQWDGVDYCFAPEISEADRQTVVENAAPILSAIRERTGAAEEGWTLCLRSDDYAPWVRDHRLYLGLANVDSMDLPVGLAQMAFGVGVPYGLEYSLGIRTAQDLGLAAEEPEASLERALELCAAQPAYLDLNYACFLAPYADEETLPLVGRIALSFYDFLEGTGKMDLFTQYSPENYRTYLNEFIGSHGLEDYNNSDLDGTVFYNGGRDIRLVWENTDGIFYVYEGYEAKYPAQDESPDEINSAYPYLRGLVADYKAQAAYMRQVLENFEPDTSPVTVRFFQNPDHNYRTSGAFLSSTEEIQMYWNHAFQHEYGHYLFRDQGPQDWVNECFCSYYNVAAMTPQLTDTWYAEVLSAQALDPNDPEDAEDYAFEQEVAEHLGHPVDMYSMEDYIYDLNAYLIWKGRDLMGEVVNESGGRGAKICFYYYLTTLRGEEAVKEALWNQDPESVFGRSWMELRRDWKQSCEETFAWVGR